MAEYIEREALIAKLRRIAACDWNKKAAPVCWSDAYEAFAQDIEDEPAADVVEVVRGEWIEADATRRGQRFICSECAKIAYFPQPTRDKKWVKRCGYDYCPNCGAKMDGGKHEQEK